MQKHMDRSSSDLLANDAESLFKKYFETHDPYIRETLISIHLSLVRFLAGKFANRGEHIDDLIQVGTIGLINAIDRFDPERGTKFSTYATPTIIGEIRRHFRDKAWSLKVPRHLQELNLTANKAIEALTQELGAPPTIEQISNRIDATEEETIEAIELGNAYETVSLDTKLSSENESNQARLIEFLGKNDVLLDNISQYGDLTEALDALDPRERSIIYLRFFSDLSQTEVAQKLNISQMHVSRLQQKALKKLRNILSE